MLLTIIIPAYNVACYIKKCIESCEEQNIPYSDYEIIIINDGSTDETEYIAKELSQKYPNISIISQINSGVSSARNLGIIKSKGEYIWFIDADDWIASRCLQSIAQLIYQFHPDLIYLNYTIAYDNDKTAGPIDKFNIIPNRIYDNETFINNISHLLLATRFIYKRSLLIDSNIFYNNNLKLSEDAEFNCRVLNFAQKCVAHSDIIYYYYKHPNSALSTIKDSTIYELARTILAIKQINAHYPYIAKYIQTIYSILIIDTFKRLSLTKNIKIKTFFFEFLDKNNIKNICLIQKYKLFELLYNKFSPRSSYYIIKLIYKTNLNLKGLIKEN